jgi:DnaJ-class molecular chaperone
MVETGIGDINRENNGGGYSSPSRCAVCSGIGYKKDYNSGQMEMCYYCNGSGLR